ncbi:EAL domain-containing protein [bacterium]|nr:EAL domain-containing protein [bacterium]
MAKHPILFVDDESNVRELFRAQAERLGYTVETAQDGVEAIQRVRERHFPIIVTDLYMPGLDGLALLECLRGLSPDSVTMIVTGAPETELPRADARDCSLAAIVRKPWNYHELGQVLERAIQLYQSGRPSGLPGLERILLIEDDPVDERLTIARLSKDVPNFSVHVVRRLDEAEHYLSHQQVQVILTDLNLPDCRGVEAVERLRHVQPGAAIVVLSGAQSEQMAIAALKQGAQDYLLKDLADGPALKRSIRYALERKSCELKLLDLAYTDAITGLPNRKLFHDRLLRAVSRARRNQSELALLYIDLDRFKIINDTLGHEAGDQVLKVVADRLLANLRGTDTVARLGGDEFAALLEGAGQRDVARLAEKLIAAVCEPIEVSGRSVSVGASVGASLYPRHGFTVDGLLRAADVAMYKSKHNGKGRVSWAQAEDDEQARERAELEQDLQQALARGEFELHFQPQMELRDYRTVAFEALLRWRRRGKLIPASQFLPVVAEMKMNEALTHWVLDQACSVIASTPSQAWRVAVNIGAPDVTEGLPLALTRALRSHNIGPERLELELTESVLCQDKQNMAHILSQLHELGVRLTLDNFGTGASSLVALRRLPVQGLKIDGSFLTCGENARFARSVIEVGHALGLRVTAEKVENHAQLDLLIASGCDVIQGCLVADPLDPALLKNWSPLLIIRRPEAMTATPQWPRSDGGPCRPPMSIPDREWPWPAARGV